MKIKKIDDFAVINESYGSNTLAILFKNTRYLPSYVKHELKWDKITDSDIEIMSPKDAAKLAYKDLKKSSFTSQFIIWVDDSDEIVAVTDGLYIYYGYKIGKSVRTISKAYIKEAIVIKDANRFSTVELKQTRRQQKQGALALKDDVDIAYENRKRYEEMKKQRTVNKIAGDDAAKTINRWMEELTDLYIDLINKITHSDDFKANYSNGSLYKASDNLKKINDSYNVILKSVENANFWRRNDMKVFNEKVIELKKIIEEFCIKYELENIIEK